MSYVITEPELVQGAAQDLAGIRESLVEATATVSGPTTAIAAAGQDEISIAIASMFGNFGQEFQVLNAQVQAFHAEFETLLTSGAAAYLGAEAANAGQVLTNAGNGLNGAVTALQNGSAAALVSGQIQTGAQAVSQSITGFQTGLGALAAGGAPGLINGINAFGATVAAPYQTLFSNTASNLQSLGSAISANPAPFLHQLATNQTGYAQTFATGLGSAIQNLPAELANLPANIQSGVAAASALNPGALLQQFITTQTGYVQTISTSLQNAAGDFGTGAAALPAAFQAAGQALLAGNIPAAVGSLQQGFTHLFYTGLGNSTDPSGVIHLFPTGALGDLLPILSIPGQMAQNLTNLLPAGSIPAQLSQDFTNVVSAVTNTNISSTLGFDLNVGIGVTLNATVGLPALLGIAALGGPASALNALGSSATAFINAVGTGNASAAAAAVLDAPAVVANGFLNGQTATLNLPVTVNFLGLPPAPSILHIPLDGILAPPSGYTASVDLSAIFGPGLPIDQAPVTGTPIGGILPGLLEQLSAELAAAIGGPPAPVIPPLS